MYVYSELPHTGDFNMTDSDEAEYIDDEIEEQRPAVRGSFVEIYNLVTRKSYIYQDGDWIPKPDPKSDAEPFYGSA